MPRKSSKRPKRTVKAQRELADTSRESLRGSKRKPHKRKRLSRDERSKLNRFLWQQRWVWLAAWRQRIYARLVDKGLIPSTETGQPIWKPGKQPAFSIPNEDVDRLNAAFHAQRTAKRAAEAAMQRAQNVS